MPDSSESSHSAHPTTAARLMSQSFERWQCQEGMGISSHSLLAQQSASKNCSAGQLSLAQSTDVSVSSILNPVNSLQFSLNSSRCIYKTVIFVRDDTEQ
jgi:hypothetical protein